MIFKKDKEYTFLDIKGNYYEGLFQSQDAVFLKLTEVKITLNWTDPDSDNHAIWKEETMFLNLKHIISIVEVKKDE